jgi:Tol biopolymer transport system component
VELSPDGRSAAVHRHELPGGGDVWIMDVTRGTTARYTFDPAQHYVRGCWSADGKQLFYAATGPSNFLLLRKPSSGVGQEDVVFRRDTPSPLSGPTSCGDTRRILFTLNNGATRYDIWALPLSAQEKPHPVLSTPFTETHPQLSPSGDWFAYQSDETGESQVYVQSFPVGRGKFQISTAGGTFPRWRRDGKELFFLDMNGGVTAVQIESDTASFKAGTPTLLFTAGWLPRFFSSYTLYDVSPDGQRFLMTKPANETENQTVIVVNWSSELAQ